MSGRTYSRAALLVALAAVGTLLTGCMGSTSAGGGGGEGSGDARPDGYAQMAQTQTDRVAKNMIPALVTDLGVSFTPGTVRFLECQLTGWSYVGDLDMFLPAGTDQADVPAKVASVMEEQDLQVEQRDDGSVVGRDGQLSVLLGTPLGPATRPYRHLTFKNDCTPYSDADVEFAESAQSSDYATAIPPDSVYDPAG